MLENTVSSPKYDVFIVHSSKDAAKARIFNQALIDMGYVAFDNLKEVSAFAIGRPVFDNIIHAVKHSKLVLILITKHAISSHWVTLETLVALEKSDRENILCVRLVFEGVSETERQNFKRGILTVIPDIIVDFNKDKWKEEFAAIIKENIPIQKLLPAGNVAHGLVFNYFIGYLAYVLPAMSKSVEKIEYFTHDKFSKKFFVVMPESCEVKPLEGKYKNFVIEKMERSLEIEATHGDKQRKYNLAVYKITKENEFYYFCADCPFIIATMFKMKEMGFADIDVHFQGVRFYMTLKELVEHRSNPEYKDTANFIMFNGIAQSSSPALEIWELLKTELSTNEDHDTTVVTRNGFAVENYPSLTVSVINSTEGDIVAEEVIQFLTMHGMNFTSSSAAKKLPDTDDTCTRWKIFILTDTSTKDKVMEHKFNDALSESIFKNQVQVIPILVKGVDIETIPYRFKWTTVLKQEDPKYLEKMWKTVHEDKPMEELQPAGSLFEGLAYSYMLNYMPFNLVGKTVDGRDFTGRFVDAVKKYKVNCKIVPKVYVIVPSSCEFPPSGTQFEKEEHLGPVEPIVQGFRKYFLQLYALTISRPGKWKDVMTNMEWLE
ncbi:stimulator of interferon genes protein-like isoform X3 [Mercenaria mercenaria]|uniref:stimulator of interferon genes protein-like isoform X3 n=1 Tax=Mercenaria mercenaria TaxID=6596 RepID=UPI00234F3C2F|nr:stimulator of interferon genes protein-like isoform X3 [Mercenaria mercenaria]